MRRSVMQSLVANFSCAPARKGNMDCGLSPLQQLVRG